MSEIKTKDKAIFSLYFIFALFIIASPAYRQIFKKTYYPLRPWVMFSSHARNICEIEYFDKTQNTPLNRAENLYKAKRQRILISKKDVLEEIKLFCLNRERKNENISARYRCASNKNWKNFVKLNDICQNN